MAISMLDQMLFRLACGHDVVLGRMANLTKWVCEECGEIDGPDKNSVQGDIGEGLGRGPSDRLASQGARRNDYALRLDLG